MAAFINANPALVIGCIVAIAIAASVIVAVYVARGSEKRQLRMLGGLRRNAEQQARTMAQLGESLNAAMRQVEGLTNSVEARQDRLRRSVDERMELMSQVNDRQLEQIREIVTEKLDGRLNASFKVVNSQLADVHKGLGEMRELALGVNDLKKMLGGVKTRGVWGEVQLKQLLEQLFAPGQYIENAAIPEGSQTRVEFALKLPTAGPDAPLLPIDAKFPQEDYLRLVDAAQSGDQDALRRSGIQLERAVIEQARRIHDKYVKPPQTADFAVMFLPTESLYAEVARRDGLIERVQDRQRVLIAGPATLCALLTSLQMGFRTCALEKRSGEVLNTLAAMKQDFGQLDESIRRMRQRLSQAEDELNSLEARARKALRAIDQIDEE